MPLNTALLMTASLFAHSASPAVGEVSRVTTTPTHSPQETVLFAWPLRPSAQFSDWHYWVIGAFVDHDSEKVSILDYNCLDRTYDGHNGTDIGIYPFKWNMMKDDLIEVVAAADGTLEDVQDGNPDMNCFGPMDVPMPPVDANRVTLSHSDGSQTVYAHMKNGSITLGPAQKGMAVKKGQKLGVIGSSGQSAGPHLHFEVRVDGKAIDPFFIPNDCVGMVGESLWESQPSYYAPRVFKLMTTSMLVEDGVQCGELSVTHEKIAFCPGDDLYMYRFYGDISANHIGSVDLLDPNGDSYLNSPQLDTPDDMLSVYLTRRFRNNSPIVLPDIQGTWTMKVTLDGESYERAFEVTLDACSPSSCGSTADCLMGQVCALGTCVTGNCTSDADCQDDQICLPGEWKCTAESGTAGGEAGTGGAGDESTGSASTAASTTTSPLPQPTSGAQPAESGEDPSPTSGPVDGETSTSSESRGSSSSEHASDASTSGDGCGCSGPGTAPSPLAVLLLLSARRRRFTRDAARARPTGP